MKISFGRYGLFVWPIWMLFGRNGFGRHGFWPNRLWPICPLAESVVLFSDLGQRRNFVFSRRFFSDLFIAAMAKRNAGCPFGKKLAFRFDERC